MPSYAPIWCHLSCCISQIGNLTEKKILSTRCVLLLLIIKFNVSVSSKTKQNFNLSSCFWLKINFLITFNMIHSVLISCPLKMLAFSKMWFAQKWHPHNKWVERLEFSVYKLSLNSQYTLQNVFGTWWIQCTHIKKWEQLVWILWNCFHVNYLSIFFVPCNAWFKLCWSH